MRLLACATQGHPIHLWDALSGELRASYRVYNAADEVTAACSIAFDGQGQRLFAGLNNRLCIFDLARPGRYYKNIVPHSRASPGLQGVAFHVRFRDAPGEQPASLCAELHPAAAWPQVSKAIRDCTERGAVEVRSCKGARESNSCCRHHIMHGLQP